MFIRSEKYYFSVMTMFTHISYLIYDFTNLLLHCTYYIQLAEGGQNFKISNFGSKYVEVADYLLWGDKSLNHFEIYVMYQMYHVYILNTVKPANGGTSIKQSPVLKGHLFVVLS